MNDFNLDNLTIIETVQFNRSIELHNAIEKNRNFNFIENRQISQYGIDFEMLIVEIECDEVPDANKIGINYRELLGILVPNSNDIIPKVWALREDFPKLIHMDGVAKGMPNQLCLYNQIPLVTNRTWTAEKFLKQIYFWIANSSVNNLHFSDQPLEQLFFSSKHELILPSIAKNKPGEILGAGYIHDIQIRDNNSKTFILKAGVNDNSNFKVLLIGINLDPLVHGTILNSPISLSNLFAIDENKNKSIEHQVKNSIHKLIFDGGIDENHYVGWSTIFVLNIPLARSPNAPIEKYQLQAYFAEFDPIKIGLTFNYLLKVPNDNKIYKDLTETTITSDKDVAIDVMEVLFFNSKDDFRNQSANLTQGGNNTLVGLGALGGVLSDLWTRCGWGKWTFVDNDFIKPHNITRHIANSNAIGLNKALLCAYLSKLCLEDEIHYIDDDVMHEDVKTKDVLQNSSLVIDASTTVDYPRKISFDNNYSRHCSVFITPNGKDSVLMIEDINRAIKLRTIEAQYYRFLLNDDCGKSHLEGHLGNYITGMSCRDVSFKMPFSSIMVHAANLSDKIIELSEQNDQKLIIWKRDKSTGAVNVFNCDIHKEIHVDLGDYQVFFDDGLKSKLENIRKQKLPNETGGILLGYYDFNHNSIFIVDALGEPSDSLSSPTGFQRGILGCKAAIEDSLNRTAHIVNYIGEWHSHPRGSSSNQSTLDVVQLCNLSQVLSEDGLPALQLIISEDSINLVIAKSE